MQLIHWTSIVNQHICNYKYTVIDIISLSSGSTPLSQQFRQKYTPCCDAFALDGYCGQEDAGGRRQYNLCPNPERYFFWDYVHPTQAGWKAVMDLLEEPIQDFLGISY
jgi:phospholipase/lecithinase/hemolysin